MKPLKITQQITDRSSEALVKYFNEVSKIPLLTVNEEYDVAMKAKDGDILSRERLVKANLRFVISVAKQYKIKSIELIDLIGAGNQGLYESIKDYDPEMGNKFISYAVWKIRSRIIDFLNKNSSTIAIPGKRKDEIRKMKRVINTLEQHLEREPTKNEIFDALSDEFSFEQIGKLIDADRTSVSSYDEVIGYEGYTLMDSISGTEDSEYIIKGDDRNNVVTELLSKMSGKERDVLINLFGIGCRAMEIGEVAERWGLASTTIKNTRDMALKKMKRRINRNNLSSLYKTF